VSTLAWVGAMVALLWLSQYMFNDVGNAPLGFACLVGFFVGLVCLIDAAVTDWQTFFGKKPKGE